MPDLYGWAFVFSLFRIMKQSVFILVILLSSFLLLSEGLCAQTDTSFFLLQKKGLLKKLGEAIWIESPQFELQNNAAVIKNESRFTSHSR